MDAILETPKRRTGRQRQTNPTYFHPLYDTWRGMKSRCYCAGYTGFKNYGARGITVCDRWRNSFHAFIDDMGPRPSLLHTLDRIDNDGNYEPGNVRWATAKEQNGNRRCSRSREANK